MEEQQERFDIIVRLLVSVNRGETKWIFDIVN